MQNIIEEHSDFSNLNCINNDFKTHHDNMSSTSLKDDSIKNFENNNFYFPHNSEKDGLLNHSLEIIIPQNMLRKKRLKNQIFQIAKIKTNKIINPQSLSEDESDNEPEIELNADNDDIRVSAKSKVNFSKLNENEKDERLKNLAKLVKRLRRKTRNLEQRFKSNANKILGKYISNSLGIKKNKQNNNPLDLSIENLCKSIKILRQYEKFEYKDQSHVIENFINLIAEQKLQLDSISFRKICTQIRLFISKESSNFISDKGQKITFSFPEKDVNITTKEYELYSKYKDKEEIMRTIFGIPEDNTQNIYPDRINFKPKYVISPNQKLEQENLSNPYSVFQNSNLRNNDLSKNYHLQDQLKNIEILKNNFTNNFTQYQDPIKNNFGFNNYNMNDLVNLGLMSNNGNLQNLFINSMYSNLIQNISSKNNPY